MMVMVGFPVIVTTTYSVNALTYETLNMSLISSSDQNLSSLEVICIKFSLSLN